MITKYKTTILGWEIHAFDEDGKIYVKEKFTHQFGILCNNLFVIRDDECATIYDGDIKKDKYALAKIYLEPTEALCITTEHC